MAESTEKTSRSRTAKQQAPPPDDGGSEDSPQVSASQLVEQSLQFLGYPSHAAAGGLSKHGPDDMLTVDDAKAEVEEWLQTPVSVDEEG